MDGPVRDDVFLFEVFRLDRRGGGLFRRDEPGDWVLLDVGGRALDVLAVFVASPAGCSTREGPAAAAFRPPPGKATASWLRSPARKTLSCRRRHPTRTYLLRAYC